MSLTWPWASERSGPRGGRAGRGTEQLERGLRGLAAGEHEEGPARRGHREIVPQPLDEPRPLALHRRQEREHLDGEDARGMGERIEHRLALRLLEWLFRELAPQVLRDAAGDRVGRSAHPRIVAVAAPRQRA